MKKVLLATVMLFTISGTAFAGDSFANAYADGFTQGWGSGSGDKVEIRTRSSAVQTANTATGANAPGPDWAHADGFSINHSEAYGVVYTNGGSASVTTSASGRASASSHSSTN